MKSWRINAKNMCPLSVYYHGWVLQLQGGQSEGEGTEERKVVEVQEVEEVQEVQEVQEVEVEMRGSIEQKFLHRVSLARSRFNKGGI